MTKHAVVAPVVLALVLAGCSSGHKRAVTSGDASLLTPYGKPIPTSATGGERAAGSTGGGFTASDSAGGAKAAAPGLASQTGPLRAGSVDDNAHFSDYLSFLADMKKAGVNGDPLDVSERHVVTVKDSDGKPVLAATVELLDGDKVVQSARSHADGRALLFPKVAGGGDTVRVTLEQETVTKPLPDGDLTVQLEQARPEGPVKLDLHFLVDTTGSMQDEIDKLRTSLDTIAKEIDALPSKPEVRYGLTVYRDKGDAYVSLTHDFTDLATFRKELSRTNADGGGDTPEALDEAFHGAMNGPGWDSDGAVQLAFLVADAAPHLDDGSQRPSYAKDVLVAQQKGIEVVPLAASGTDDPAELVFRELAEYSLGTFFFLTYGEGDTTDRHVTGYQAGSLDEQVVGHVTARLKALAGGQ
jgi:hypothetical protein